MADHPSIPRLAAGIAACLALALAPPLAAEKTDVVVFDNGDRLTGEVKKVERGKLAFKTAATDTIQIDWENVARLVSGESFDVETRSGERFFGSLVPAEEEGKLTVAGEEESWALDLDSVVRVTPIEAGFWKRVDGNLDLGFSFTEADERTQVSVGAQAQYRTRKYLRSLSSNSVVVSQPKRDSASDEVQQTNRSDLSLFVTRYLRKPRRHFLGFATLQRNEELGLDLRSLVGAAAGWNVIQSNTEILGLAAGVAVSQEQLLGSDPSQENLEAFLGLQLESFKFDTPERDVDLTLAVFPGLSQSGRVRAELSAKVRWEIVNDFFFGLSLLESYDNGPPAAGEGEPAKSDLTLTTSLGWSF